MKLTTGKVVPDKFLTDLCKGIVDCYASFGFEDWVSAVDVELFYYSELGIEKADFPDLEADYMGLTQEELEEIGEVVEPIAQQFSSLLRNRYAELYKEVLEDGDKVWTNPKLSGKEEPGEQAQQKEA